MARRRRSLRALLPDKSSSEIIRWRNGDTSKADPFFILVINNIALERPLNSNKFVADMSTGTPADRKKFAAVAQYVDKNLFGQLPNQAEKLLSDSPHSAKIRLWSIYLWGLAPNGASALVGEDSV